MAKRKDKTKTKPVRAKVLKRQQANRRMMRWRPPADMPPEIVEDVRRGLMCGYCTVGGQFCREPSFPGQKGTPRPHFCRRHLERRQDGTLRLDRGKGDRRGSKSMAVSGLYTDAFITLAEKELFQQLLGQTSLDEEIAMTRVRLRRAMRYESKLEAALEDADSSKVEALLLVDEMKHERTIRNIPETRMTDDAGNEVVTPAQRLTVEEKIVIGRRLRNCEAIIDKLVRQLVTLLSQKQAQEGGGSEDTPQERAQMARELLRQVREDAANGDAA